MTELAQDGWLDDAAEAGYARRHPALAVLHETFGKPVAHVQQWLGFLGSSPGLMTVMTFVISVALLAAGLSMAQSSQHRQDDMGILISNTEPMSFAAHNLYSSLSIADTASTTGFVQAGVESPQTRERYLEALHNAQSAAIRAAAGLPATSTDGSYAGDRDQLRSMELLTTIETNLPVYTGLVETARANNRAGHPVGSAYLAESTAIMRENLLPAASELFKLTGDRVTREHHALSRPQWVPISGLVAAIIMLLLAQWWLWVRTRRRINGGFALATIFMVTALLWVGGANWVAWQAGNRGFAEAAAPLNSMTNARIFAQQSRSNETLSLVARQGISAAGGSLQETRARVDAALDEYEQSDLGSSWESHHDLAAARIAVEEWEQAHDELIRQRSTGDYEGALAIALGEDSSGPNAADAFNRLDSAMAILISQARDSLREYIRDGLSASQLVAASVLVLSILSTVSIWLGIRPRLQEYI